MTPPEKMKIAPIRRNNVRTAIAFFIFFPPIFDSLIYLLFGTSSVNVKSNDFFFFYADNF